MFFYVSFLRPPPTRAPLSSPLLITPQISNDLRTEPCESDQDVFYDWIFVDHGTSNGPRNPIAGSLRGAPGKQLGMKKLMTWRNANAYREIPVAVPPSVQEGQQWRLILAAVPVGKNVGTSGAATTASRGAFIPSNARIHLDDEKIGRWLPFGVSSMPITFTYASKGAPKQEEIERTYEFKMAGASEADIRPTVANASQAVNLQDISNRLKGLQQVEDAECACGKSKTVKLVIREQTSFDLDKKIWDSGIGLSAWLVQWLNTPAEPHLPQVINEGGKPLCGLKSIFTSTGNLNILELGSGTGILALTVAALRSRISDAEDRILTTDLESAIPLMKHNIDFNKSTFSEKIIVKPGVLDWDQSLADQLPDGTGFDLVIMADVAYNTDSFPALIRTLAGVRNINPDKNPLLLLGYKERHDEERMLWDLVKAIGIDFEKVCAIPGHASGGAPIEIWVG